MKHFLVCLSMLGILRRASTNGVSASEFKLEGDYLVGGLFNIHQVTERVLQGRPDSIDCSSQPLARSSYRRFQVMRFSVEEINNSTTLLPNVQLGYEIFDHCSDLYNLPGIFNLISPSDHFHPWDEKCKNVSTAAKVIAVVGTYTSTESLTVAPIFMMNYIPMVSYGAASSVFSRKQKFPAFFRTMHPNKDVIEVIFNILLHFDWRWVAFLNVDNDYGRDGQESFVRKITGTKICLAYTKDLSPGTNYSQVFGQINAQQVHVIIVFAAEWTAETLLKSAIRLNFTNKVWIAGDAWSLNKKLPKVKGIKSIGTVLGVAEPLQDIPGFADFIYSSKSHGEERQQTFCNQYCKCSGLSAEDVVSADPSFSFAVYSAVYAIAHALHNVLQCGAGTCNGNITVYPYMVLAELRKSNFTLLNQRIQFDENGDPTFGSYSIVFWNQSGDAEELGFYDFPPSFDFFINNSKIQWHSGGEVPTSVCSPECPEGQVKKVDEMQDCCFTCKICQNGSYVNSTRDPHNCIDCAETEWSAEGSTSCKQRLVEYMSFRDIVAVVIMVMALAFVGITLAMSILLAVNYNTPVVRSAGGPMCFLILGCLSLCSISVFFYFGKPTPSSCILRFLPFNLFYTVCIACFVVRSFQIVCIFKIGAKFPQIHSWWIKYHGHWLIITVIFVTQMLLVIFGNMMGTPKPYNDTVLYPDKIILGCDVNMRANSSSLVLLLFLCSLCFIFSYMGKDLPKNYNEAKSITFCLVLLIITWTVFATEVLLHHGKYIVALNAAAVLSSLYSFLLTYFLPKCYIIIFQPHKNTQQYFQGLIQNYTKTISQ